MATEEQMIGVDDILLGIETFRKCYKENAELYPIAAGAFGAFLLVEEFVKRSRTVKAVEVVHGQWERHLAPYTENYWTCTCCNGNFMTDAAQYWKYCPNCGAKMDLEKITHQSQ